MAVIQLELPIAIRVTTSRGTRDFGSSDSSNIRPSLEVKLENLENTPKFVRLDFEGQSPDRPGKTLRETVRHGVFFLVKKDHPRDAYFKLQRAQWYLTKVTIEVHGQVTEQTLRELVTDFDVSEERDELGFCGTLLILIIAVIVVLMILG